MSIYKERCETAQSLMAQQNLDYLFVAPSADMYYFIGYAGHITERLTLLVIPANGEINVLLPAFEARRLESLATFFSLNTWMETDNPYEHLLDLLGDNVNSAIRVGVSDDQWARFLLGFQSNLPQAKFVISSIVTGQLRIGKGPEEIALLREANRRNDNAFAEFVQKPMLGKTEKELQNILSALMIEHGQESVAFANPYSGPNSSSPHHTPTNRVVEAGDAVLFDFGGTYGGYYSDTSRTVVVDHTPEEFENVYKVVLEAHQLAIDAISPGVLAGEIDTIARTYISDAGFGDCFPHRVGHGVGLNEHEPPYLTGDNRQLLQEGMCFSVEPGIYLPGRFGVRIEDTLLVTANGSERLSNCTRDLLMC